MLVNLTTTAEPATDLGYLLHKHPDKVQRFSQSFGAATVFYPEATAQKCTATLLLEVDPVALSKARKSSPDFALSQYVNDRPYAASSLLAVALGKVYSTARRGECQARPQLAAREIPLEIEIPSVPCRGGPELVKRLFEPLGWQVEAGSLPLDEAFPEWGDSRYVHLRLNGSARLSDALNQLYVLLPVLDDAKHYWVDLAEVSKFVRGAGGWIASHPDRNLITRRYLARRSSLERFAYQRLAELDESAEGELEPPVDEEPAASSDDTSAAETPADTAVPLNRQRHEAVLQAVFEAGAKSVIDLGCGSGKLLQELQKRRELHHITGVDVSTAALKIAARTLRLDRLGDRQAERLSLFQGALTYTDERFGGYDAAILMEVIEHVDPPRLAALERVVFGSAQPGTVVVTTPNVEYNVHYGLEPGCVRHRDHRFEWDRAQFGDWARSVATHYGYRVDIRGIGAEQPDIGHPTQLGVFTRD